ncbi:MAG: prolipoprotein diacylglyceryl transferase [Bacteroidetes bacterium]|nr:prolipoprotein diacylglyceryl transferase [Bacteroidota bacterium]
MYPTVSDLIKDIFGIYIPLPIQSFGLFVAISFIISAFLIMEELKRKENLGVISVVKKKILIGKPASASELLIMALLGFVLGYKLLEIVFNYTYFASNPQTFIFSSEGNIYGGIIGAFITAYLRYREKQKQKLEKPYWDEVIVHPFELTGNIIMYAAVFGIIGSKIFNSLENIDDFISDPFGSLFSFSGLTFYGGFIIAAIVIIIYTKKKNIPPLVIADIAAPSLILGYAIGRIGCQVAGDGDWGIVNTMIKPDWLAFLPDWLWAYNYPHNVLSEGIAIPGCVGKHCFMLDPPVFPTPIYETIICTLFFIILWSIRKKITTTGVMFAIFLMMNGVERFFIEKIRVNNKYHIFGKGVTQAEIISAILFFAGVVLLIYILNKKKKNNSNADNADITDIRG